MIYKVIQDFIHDNTEVKKGSTLDQAQVQQIGDWISFLITEGCLAIVQGEMPVEEKIEPIESIEAVVGQDEIESVEVVEEKPKKKKK